MAHIKERRESMQYDKWISAVFEQVAAYCIADKELITGWTHRTGRLVLQDALLSYDWIDEKFHPLESGEIWGGPDSASLLLANGTMPERFLGQSVHLHMFTTSEVIVKNNDVYVGGIDPNRTMLQLTKNAKSSEPYTLILEAYNRSRPDDLRNRSTRGNLVGCVHYFDPPCLVVLDELVQNLYYDLLVLYEAAYESEHMGGDIQSFLRKRLEEMLPLFPPFGFSQEELHQTLPVLRNYIDTQIYSSAAYMGKAGNVALVGHSHLDIAYHWQALHTIQKNARTVLIQLKLMEKYDDFLFTHSQAWVYEQLEHHYPEIFSEVKQRIAEGRWEVVGGMYVEPDCNLISAESFVRQILYGKQYFRETFGVDVDNAWLPDVFGNSPIMPQILRSGGIDYFVTHKLAVWNDTNPFPHNHFLWEGLDGSRIDTCVPPVHFVTWMDTDETLRNWQEFKQKDMCRESLQLYGYGDGGSGVTEEMLERAKRQNRLPGIPTQTIKPACTFLQEAFAQNRHRLPLWKGDLYLEMHRGTYTTKAHLKRLNRLGEYCAQYTETLLYFTAHTVQFPLNKKVLEDAWKLLLLNQFHDILPGSHTAPVDTEARETYQRMFVLFATLEKEALDALTVEAEKQNLVAFNPYTHSRKAHSYARIEEKDWPNGHYTLKTATGNISPVACITHADGSCAYYVEDLFAPALSLSAYVASTDRPVSEIAQISVSLSHLENQYFYIKFDNKGIIYSLYDKLRSSEMCLEGCPINQWHLYEDKPGALNAWDILPRYTDQSFELPVWENITIHENGPITVALRMERKFYHSRAVQIVRLFRHKPTLDFDVWIDWQEEERLLKTSFPLAIHPHTYTVDTSAGGFERMNQRNTTWEQACFEVPCHKWVSISEGMRGAALLNNGKYGCDVQGHTMSLSLLKAPIAPDRMSDREEHHMMYSLYLYDGHWQSSELAALAREFNFPLQLHSSRKPLPEIVSGLEEGLPCNTESLIKADCPYLETIACKLAEDGSGDIVVRWAELLGYRGEAVIQTAFSIHEVFRCNILEEPEIEPLCFEAQGQGSCIKVSVRPNEILSVRIRPKGRGR